MSINKQMECIRKSARGGIATARRSKSQRVSGNYSERQSIQKKRIKSIMQAAGWRWGNFGGGVRINGRLMKA